MSQLSREYMETLNEVFDTFALKDQESYYLNTIEKYRKAAAQANFIRALFAFLGGLASALIILVTALDLPPATSRPLTIVLILVAITGPALGAAAQTLADLYQWDRLVTIFTDTRESLAVADAASPDEAIDNDVEYRGHLDAFVEATLMVMKNETAQWGQLIQPPQQTQEFIDKAKTRAAAAEEQAKEALGTDRNGQPQVSID